MPRVMRHPYWGDIVQCNEHTGDQHIHGNASDWTIEDCFECEDSLIGCRICRALITCCACGRHHSIDCDWPL